MPNVSSECMSEVEWEQGGDNEGKRFVRGQFNLRQALFSGTLTIYFQARGTYNYYNVPTTVWLSLMKAGSKGRYFNDNIKGKYSFDRVA